MGEESIAKAYVQIIPTAKGIKGELTEMLGGEADSAGRKSGGLFSKSFGGALGGIGKIAAGALAAAGAAVGAIVKEAVGGFADYEQLVGGVETLFKDSADQVQAYAAQAYKTAGISANEYMEQVTSFSASLLQSLGGNTEAAARVGDMAIKDMADNANKMGTSMESIQNAYQGFAKQNYTMLDNLKLGYGGTKQEMERLLADAEKLTGIEYDISNLSDVYSAIHAIQQEMGITGTTAKEASETISGSVNALKAAWKDALAGIANENADFEQLVANLADSALTAMRNLVPRIGTALKGVGKLVEGLAPVIEEALPTLVGDVIPELVKIAASLVMTLVKALIDNLPSISEAAVQIVLQLADTIAENADDLAEAAAEGIVAIVDALTQPETLEKLIEVAVKLVLSLVAGLIKAIPHLIEAVGVLVLNIIKAIGNLGADLIEAGIGIVKHIASGIAKAAKAAVQWGRDMIDNFVAGIRERIQSVIDTVKEIAGKIKEYLGFSEPEVGPLSNFHTYAPDMMELFAEGIRDNEHLISDQIAESFGVAPQMLDVGSFGRSAGSFAPASETATAARESAQITLHADINLDGQRLWSGLLPYQRQGESLMGRGIVSYV